MRLSMRTVTATLLLLAAMTAQVSAQGADPVSGKWSGFFFRPTDGTRTPITMDLALDAAGAISGKITGSQSVVIKIGTYDAGNGAMRLEVELPNDGGARRFVFDGTVVDGSAIGRVSSDNQRGAFRITKGAAAAGTADPRNPNDAKDVMLGGFAEVTGWVSNAAEMVPADKYSYRPSQTVRTFGQLIGHIADSHNWYCANAGGKNTEWSDAIEKGTSDKAGLAQKLKQSIDACNALYNGTGRTKELMANIAHTSLHYGNIITYMRMMGLVPPSS